MSNTCGGCGNIITSCKCAEIELKNLKAEFAYATECQLATLEDYRSRKRVAKTRVERQRQIAARMVRTCYAFDCTRDRRGRPCTRVQKALEGKIDL